MLVHVLDTKFHCFVLILCILLCHFKLSLYILKLFFFLGSFNAEL